MDNLEKMDKFLVKYNLPKLNQKQIENINNPVTSTETQTIVKKLSNNNNKIAQDQMASQANSTKGS